MFSPAECNSAKTNYLLSSLRGDEEGPTEIKLAELLAKKDISGILKLLDEINLISSQKIEYVIGVIYNNLKSIMFTKRGDLEYTKKAFDLLINIYEHENLSFITNFFDEGFKSFARDFFNAHNEYFEKDKNYDRYKSFLLTVLSSQATKTGLLSALSNKVPGLNAIGANIKRVASAASSSINTSIKMVKSHPDSPQGILEKMEASKDDRSGQTEGFISILKSLILEGPLENELEAAMCKAANSAVGIILSDVAMVEKCQNIFAYLGYVNIFKIENKIPDIRKLMAAEFINFGKKKETLSVNSGNMDNIELNVSMDASTSADLDESNKGVEPTSNESLASEKLLNTPNLYSTFSSYAYETLEESLKTAGFKNIRPMMKYSREIATYLKRLGKYKSFGITQADAMALTIYTYDNGPDNFEDNPYRIVNKTLGERNTKMAMNLRGYFLRLLAALRKLPAYSDTKPLYRAVTNVSDRYLQKGNVITWTAFTSTSSDEISVIDFFNNIVMKGDRYILEITGCFNKGHSIRDFSFHSDEDEILFEPDTQFEIIEIKPDPKVDGVTRIHVEVLPTDPVLADVVENFVKMCEKNIDKENPKENHNTKKEGAVYKGPVVPKDEWHDFWNDVEKSQKECMSLKRALEFMKEGNLREMLVDGYKRAIIDDDYCDGAEMMKGYEISVEEGAALYSCTHKYGEEGSPSWAVGRMVSEWVRNRRRGIDPHGTNYLLHIASSLEKLPLWGVSMDDNKPDDKDGNEPDSKDDDDDDKLDDKDGNEPRETKRIYLCMKKEDLKELERGKEYVIGSVFAGSVERPSAGKGECVVCVEDAQNLCVREVGPLSAWNKIGYVLGLPGAHIAVKSIPPSLNDDNDDDDENDVIVRAVPMSPEEKSECDACIKHFISLLPLPEGWSVETDDDTGRTFYQNNITYETQWVKPVIEDPGFFTDFDLSFLVVRKSAPAFSRGEQRYRYKLKICKVEPIEEDEYNDFVGGKPDLIRVHDAYANAADNETVCTTLYPLTN